MAVFSGATTTTTLRDAAPKWAAVSDKLTQLCEREEQIFAEMKPLQKALNDSANCNFFGSRAPNPNRQPTTVKASQAAADILGDLTPAPKVVPVYEEPVPAEVVKLRPLIDELNAVREAISLLRDPQNGERRSRWTEEHLEGSQEFCRIIEPEYRQVTSGYVEALLALGRATVAYNEFLKSRCTGVAIESLRPIQTAPSLGDPLDPTSELRRILTWAAECGHFDLASLPNDWRQGVQK